ncbi:MAG: DUF47 domain-containing protein [Hyphomicrobiaceae bacterium]
MRNRIQGALASFFGPSRNDRFAELLRQVSKVALDCSAHFRKTKAQDAAGIVEFEHRADRLVAEIHELLDNSFIMRFDIPDAMRLTDDLDDVVDGMRKVVLHVDAYKVFLSDMRPGAIELMDLSGAMLVHVDKLVAMLAEPRLSLSAVRVIADQIDRMESEADKLTSDFETKLVVEFSPSGANVLEFIAWHQLFHLLEQITDDANHCARQILSLARKEA